MRYIAEDGRDRLERERPQGGRRVRVRLAARDRRPARPRSRRRGARGPHARARRPARHRARAARARRVRRAVRRAASSRSPRRDRRMPRRLADAVARTDAALASDADVIYQAAFATHEFVGFADFLVRDRASGRVDRAGHQARPPRAGDRADAARGIRRPARSAGRRRAPTASSCCSATAASARTTSTTCSRSSACAASGSPRSSPTAGSTSAPTARPIAWGDPRGELGVIACGRCATCDAEVVASRDLLLVAGMRPVQRERLRAAGITTIDELAARRRRAGRHEPRHVRDAAHAGPPAAREPGRHAGARPAAPTTTASAPRPRPPVPTYEVVAPTALGALPRPDRGDLFFDFEGDPLYTEPSRPVARRRRSGASTTCSAGSTTASSTRRCGRTPSPTRSARSRASSTS